MSFNGSGVFLINTSGQPVSANTLISSSVFNALTADLATGLSTAILKDGTQTVTANIPMSTYKFTGLGAGSSDGDSLRYEQLFTTSGVQLLGAMNWVKGADIASASTVNLTTATGNGVHITGTTTITAVTLGSGMWRLVIFDGALTLTHHATNNNLPGGANITTAAGDRALYWSDGTTVYCVAYVRASGSIVVPTGGTVSVPDGTAAAPSVKVGDEQNGLFSPAANSLGFGTAGIEAFRIDSNQNVNIGSAAAVGFLNISKGLEIEQASANPGLRLERTTTNTGTIEMFVGTNGGHLRTISNSPLFIGTNDTIRVVVREDGTLQIGNITAGTGFANAGDITAAVTNAIRSRSTFSAWVRHNNAGTVTRALNVGSVTKNTTGTYTANITASVMADGSYGFVFSTSQGAAASTIYQDSGTAPTATALKYVVANSTTGAAQDPTGETFVGVLP